MTRTLPDVIAAIMDAHQIESGGFFTRIPGLRLLRVKDKIAPHNMSYRPSLCMVAQGAKEVTIGDRTVTYGEMQALVVTVEMPVLSHIVEASPERPYMAATLEMDADVILDVLTRLDAADYARGKPGFGMVVKDMDAVITSAMIRLLETVGHPRAMDILAPGILREIAYWMLTGPAGANVARMVLPDGPHLRIARAVHHLREYFDAALSVSDLAEVAGMSPSSFHQHFKTMTSMSPVQYQKQIRLLEARRRMVSDGERAAAAGFSVGYESASQFSREYARLFGAPPRRDAVQARSGLAGSG